MSVVPATATGAGSKVTVRFDLRALFLAVDDERDRQSLSWAALARHTSVATSTIRRYEEADDAEADGVLALIGWLGATPEDFVTGDAMSGIPLRIEDSSLIRVDMELVALANGDPGGAGGRTRTSIQHLVEVAQRSGQPVASLTRLSDT